MPQSPEPGRRQPKHAPPWRKSGARALRLLGLLAMAATLAACGPCGDFWPSSRSQIGACHSDPPRQQ